MRRICVLAFALTAILVLPGRAAALERFCDTAFEDCRAPLLELIANETVGIDVAFWFMEDARYSAELARAAARGVKIRVIFDSEALPGQPVRQFVVDQLLAAGIPMREKVSPGINHWKLMLFYSQNTVQFSGANHTDEAFVPIQPYVNYVDEVIYFTDRPELVNSFKRQFDDGWVDEVNLANYPPDANIPLTRAHATYPIVEELVFNRYFREWSVLYNQQENTRIDAIIYRITDRAHADSLIANVERGVGFRLISEPHQYRDESRLWHAWNVDRLYAAGLANPINGQPGIQIRHRAHAGLLHEKLTLMIGQGRTVFGSSNWTSPSSDYQWEHNLFTLDPAFFNWGRAHFDRKWNNTGPAPETQPFVPLPPDTPSLALPANGSTAQPLTVSLWWHAGPWAHKYDVFFGTDPNNLTKIVNDEEWGPYDREFVVSGLTSGTRYYWRVVSRTMANVSRTSDTWSFVTMGGAPSNTPPAVSLSSPVAGASYTAPGVITVTANATDADGAVVRVDFLAGTSVIGSATSAPFTFTWNNVPAGNYALTARAVDNLGAATTSGVVNISVTPGQGASLPAPWSHADVGAVAQAGSASSTGSTWSLTASGSDVWGAADEFSFVHQLLTGDGTIVARVATVQNVDVWTKAGVMIRESLTPGSPHGFMIVTPGVAKGLAFQRRVSASGASAHTAGGEGAPPTWVRLVRTGNVITASKSLDGINWTTVGSEVIPMANTVYVGLALTSHNNSTLATATFDNVTVTPAGGQPPANVPPTVTLTSPATGATFTAPASITLSANAGDSDGAIAKVDFYAGATLVGTDTTSPYSVTWSNVAAGNYVITARATDNQSAESVSGSASIQVTNPQPPEGLPAGWTHADVGAVGVAGNATYSGGTFTVSGAGADIWGTADAFHFTYRSMTGDGTIVARLATLEYADRWTKSGVMIRAALTAGSRHAMMIGSPGKGFAFQRRVTDNAESVHTSGPAIAPPAWVRLQRTGSTITASTSMDGVTWSVVGTETIDLPATVYVGIPITSHVDGVVATGTLDNVSVSP